MWAKSGQNEKRALSDFPENALYLAIFLWSLGDSNS
jgi:hypothetical protein